MKINLSTGINSYFPQIKPHKQQLKLQPLNADTVTFGASRKEKNYETAMTNIPQLPCACCGKIMIPENVFERPIVKNYDISATEILKVLKKYETRMHKVERNVFRRLEKLSKKNPEMNLHDLFNRKRYYHLANTEIKQLKIVSEIEKTDFNISPESQAKLNNALKNTRQIMFVEGKDVLKKRQRIIKEFSSLLEDCPEKEEFQRVLSMIQKLPSSKNDVDSFFVKYSPLDSESLAYKLLESSKASIEHVVPASENGADNSSNYIVMCRKCNNSRSSMPYEEFLVKHPEMIKNSQKYMDRIINYLNKQYIFGMDNYPFIIKKLLEDETNGLIHLDVSKYRMPYKSPDLFIRSNGLYKITKD